LKHLVVVGNGMVGHRLVETLRARDVAGQWRVTVLAEEARPAYDRVRLSAWFDGEELTLSPVEGADVRLGEPALTLDPVARTVTTAVQTLRYDALVLATGSYPFVPPIPGADLAGCFVYRTIDDLEALAAYAKGREKGVVIGGGLLGLEAANALRRLDLATDVVELAPRLMPLQVDEAGGAMLRRHIEGLGLTVHTGRQVSRVTGRDGAVRRVVFEDSGISAPGPGASQRAPASEERTGGAIAAIDADLIVFAAGVRPRDELARSAGLAVGRRGGASVLRSRAGCTDWSRRVTPWPRWWWIGCSGGTRSSRAGTPRRSSNCWMSMWRRSGPSRDRWT
jgi:nitrite reductase (NADH) large subunit